MENITRTVTTSILDMHSIGSYAVTKDWLCWVAINTHNIDIPLSCHGSEAALNRADWAVSVALCWWRLGQTPGTKNTVCVSLLSHPPTPSFLCFPQPGTNSSALTNVKHKIGYKIRLLMWYLRTMVAGCQAYVSINHCLAIIHCQTEAIYLHSIWLHIS